MLLALLLAASGGPPYLNGGSGRPNDAPNILLRVLPGGSPAGATPPPTGYTLQGSYGESLTFTRAGAATCTPNNGQIYAISTNVPCLTEGGYWADPSSTNLLVRNESFTNVAWTAASVTGFIADNTTLAPDGTMDAGTFQEADGGSAAQFGVYQAVTSVAATTYSYSVYLKPGTGSFGWLTLFDAVGGEADCLFSLVDGTVKRTNAGGGTTICFPGTAAANGFWRVSMQYTTITSEIAPQLYVLVAASAADTAPSHVGAGRNIGVFGAQFEAQAFPTRYIPTVATTVNRAAESLTDSTAIALGTTPSFSLDFTPPANDLNPAQYLFNAFNTNTDRWIFGEGGPNLSTGSMGCEYVGDGGVFGLVTDAGVVPLGVRSHFSCSYDGTTFRACVNFVCYTCGPGNNSANCTAPVDGGGVSSSFGNTYFGQRSDSTRQAHGPINSLCMSSSPWGCQ